MAEIIQFPTLRNAMAAGIERATITKVIDGEVIELIDFELLSADEQHWLLTENTRRKMQK